MGGFVRIDVGIERLQKAVLAQFAKRRRRQELDLLRTFLEAVVAGIGDLGIQVRPLLAVLRIDIAVLGKLQASDLRGRKFDPVRLSWSVVWRGGNGPGNAAAALPRPCRTKVSVGVPCGRHRDRKSG